MLSADVRALKNMGAALRKAEPAMYRGLQRSLREVGEEVAARARENFSWSSRIPGTVKARVAGVNAVVVSAGGKDAPHAKPIEHAGAEGSFRHPVFGNRDVWVDQEARPSLHPAAIDHLQESAEKVGATLTVEVEKLIHGQDRFV